MFDYKTAWKEEAAPRLLSLPSSSLQLILKTHEQTQGLRQNRDLTLGWPKGLREEFSKFSLDDLAVASHVVASAGHWHPGYNNWLKPLTDSGTYWRFSNLADQVLRERLGVGRHVSSRGFIVELLEGKLRVGYGFDYNWFSSFVGLATPDNLKTTEELWKVPDEKNKLDKEFVQKFLQDLKAKINDDRLIDTSRFER